MMDELSQTHDSDKPVRRVCPGKDKKCGTFRCSKDSDPHSLSLQCRKGSKDTSDCTVDEPCEECRLWSSEQRDRYSHRPRYKRKETKVLEVLSSALSTSLVANPSQSYLSPEGLPLLPILSSESVSLSPVSAPTVTEEARSVNLGYAPLSSPPHPESLIPCGGGGGGYPSLSSAGLASVPGLSQAWESLGMVGTPDLPSLLTHINIAARAGVPLPPPTTHTVDALTTTTITAVLPGSVMTTVGTHHAYGAVPTPAVSVSTGLLGDPAPAWLRSHASHHASTVARACHADVPYIVACVCLCDACHCQFTA